MKQTGEKGSHGLRNVKNGRANRKTSSEATRVSLNYLVEMVKDGSGDDPTKNMTLGA